MNIARKSLIICAAVVVASVFTAISSAEQPHTKFARLIGASNSEAKSLPFAASGHDTALTNSDADNDSEFNDCIEICEKEYDTCKMTTSQCAMKLNKCRNACIKE